MSCKGTSRSPSGSSTGNATWAEFVDCFDESVFEALFVEVDANVHVEALKPSDSGGQFSLSASAILSLLSRPDPNES